jgi:hypothetical protein
MGSGLDGGVQHVVVVVGVLCGAVGSHSHVVQCGSRWLSGVVGCVACSVWLIGAP